PILHEWLQRLERRELHATLKLALISVVILPLLPNTGYGPWEALNPFRIWLMVVLIAGISFTGYFAMKVVGPRYGILATGLFAGLASSTAVTVNFARLARGGRGNEDVLAAGILVACATMFPRMLLVSGAFSPALAQALAAPVVAMAAINYLAAAWFWRASGLHDGHERPRMTNPFELKPALIFAALLAAIMLLSTALAETVGEVGVYLLAAVSGIADVDAITLSLAEMPGSRIEPADAALALIIAAAANSLVKAALALGIGGAPLGWRVTSSMLAVVATGVTVWLLLAALPAA
ncbi:MAG: MgtC/SapB family protein, partial [Pseudomonadota bacterium]